MFYYNKFLFSLYILYIEIFKLIMASSTFLYMRLKMLDKFFRGKYLPNHLKRLKRFYGHENYHRVSLQHFLFFVYTILFLYKFNRFVGW